MKRPNYSNESFHRNPLTDCNSKLLENEMPSIDFSLWNNLGGESTRKKTTGRKGKNKSVEEDEIPEVKKHEVEDDSTEDLNEEELPEDQEDQEDKTEDENDSIEELKEEKSTEITQTSEENIEEGIEETMKEDDNLSKYDIF